MLLTLIAILLISIIVHFDFEKIAFANVGPRGDRPLKSMTIIDPEDVDNFFLLIAPRNMTVRNIKCLVENATSTVITVQECDANGNACSAVEAAMTCLETQVSDNGIDSPAISTGSVMRVDVGVVTGTVGAVHVTVELQ